MKSALVCACILACSFAIIMIDRSLAEEKDNQTSVNKDVVLGHLQTRDRVVTIGRGETGTTYTVKTKDGTILDSNLDDKKFQARYPSLYDQVKDGRAGNDATLRKSEIPVLIRNMTVGK